MKSVNRLYKKLIIMRNTILTILTILAYILLYMLIVDITHTQIELCKKLEEFGDTYCDTL